MSKISVLHISDIHIGNTCYKETIEIAIPILDALEDHDKKIDCVIVTGDIFDGKPDKSIDRKNNALDLFNYLKNELSLSPSDFVIVPGNHDLKRSTTSDNFEEYKSFISEFYGNDYYQNKINSEFLYCTKIFEEQKVAIIGLNSCMIESCKIEDKDINWLNEVKIDNTIRDQIITVLENKKKNEWDDYGFISKKQLRDSFKHLEDEIKELSSYTIVACFHHHFYPFPEIYSQYGDSSIIRNFTDVIEKFQQKNVKIVLHGHKHLPIIRPVTNHKYLVNPDSIFYVFSAGSISKKGVTNRSFQHIDVFSPNSNRIADVCRFNFKQEELQAPEIFSVPPRKQYEQNTFIEILDMLKEEFPEEYQDYKKEIYEYDNISQQYRIDEVLKNISRTITQFESLRKELKSSVINIQVLLFAIHYRINFLNSKTSKEKSPKLFITKLREKFSGIINDSSYENLLWKLLESNKNVSFEKIHDELFSKHVKFNDYTAHISIAVYFTNLYLTFLKYGEIYYNEENLKHKVNIKLESETFHESIPVSTIKISSNVDRRLATISFKCKNPTVHKIAVLIVKDYEKLISKIEDSFKHLGLKIYYVVPKVEKDNYDLDNLNFEAYIPTLLPLLTGENLYKRKEVFSRELIQNSLDAILLRDNLLSKTNNHLTDSEKIIRIEIGTSKNPQTGNDRKYLKIIDNGIGMDSYKIERYFTSIGRSFYKSDEFDELQKSEDIQYNPISNFGIGFLSAFMVCSEIEVITRSYDNNEYALEIHIPNYDGCFFIRKTKCDNINVGTTITLYEDTRRFLNPEKIIKYIKDTFIDFQLKIEIKNTIKNNIENIEPFKLRKETELTLFCPIIEDKVVPISWVGEIENKAFLEKYNYGILLEFNQDLYNGRRSERKYKHNQYLNSGILLSDSNMKDLDFEETEYSKFYYNLPSSLINLDVARERILSFKGKAINKKDILSVLTNQGLELIQSINESNSTTPLKTINNIAHFFKINNSTIQSNVDFNANLYSLDFKTIGDKFIIYLKKGISDNNSFLNFDFPVMVRIYYKILAQVVDIKPKLFKDKSFFDDYTSKVGFAYEQIFNNTDFSNFEKDFSYRFDEDQLNKINDEFTRYFEKEFIQMPNANFMRIFDDKFIHKYDNELMHRFEDFTHIFDSKLFHQIDEEFMRLFDNNYMNKFEKELIYKFGDSEHILREELFPEIENNIRKHPKEKFYYQEKIYRKDDEYYNLLSFIIYSNFMNEARRGKRMHLRLSNIYGLFYLLYEFIIRRLPVSKAGIFKIEV